MFEGQGTSLDWQLTDLLHKAVCTLNRIRSKWRLMVFLILKADSDSTAIVRT